MRLSPAQAERARRLLAEAETAQASGSEEDVAAAARLLVLAARQFKAAHWEPYPWQHPHLHPEAGQHGPDCRPECTNPHIPVCGPACADLPDVPVLTHGMWLQLGGRGTGKTEGAARYVDAHVKGPACDPRLPGGHRMLIVAPTQGDGAESCYSGPSGLRVVNPETRLIGGSGGLRVRWPNGAVARILGAYGPEDVERLRAAGNNCLIWMEELAAQRHLQDALDHTAMGLRIGTSPHYVASTTPKPRAEIRALLAGKTTVITKGKTRDAVRLDPTVLQSYLDKYEGTRQGRQELDAELLDDVEGALWSLSAIDADRHKGPLPTMDKIVVAVDPPGSSTGKGNAEAGIVVVGMVNRWRDPFTKEIARLPHGFVLADLSGKMTPEEWGRTAVDAFYRYSASTIAVETAYGGEMVLSTIRTIDDTVPVAKVPTKVGKKLRAEPVVSLYEQHRVHHVGILVGLETQQTEWVPGETPESPDRLDALVHGLTYLLVKHGGASASTATKTRLPGSGPAPRGRVPRGSGAAPALPRPGSHSRLQA